MSDTTQPRAGLTPTQQAIYNRQLETATPQMLQLARELQRAAFAGVREYAGDFVPAPIYLQQASAIARHAETQAKVTIALAQLVGVH